MAQTQPKELSMGLPEGLSVRQKNIIARLIETGQKNVLETSATLSARFNVNERTIWRDLKTLQT
ncbi:MAG: HTH domain-containing protein, partial [Prevotella sp.]|nr:HTH domain-containing protein [Prevotella sp.]